MLLAAAARLDGGGRIRVLGDGRERDAAHRLIRERNLPVQLVGQIPPAAVAWHVTGATAPVLPSRWPENCPMAILEAAAVGVPTIASDIGGIPEVICDGVTGRLVTPGDARGLAAVIDELAAQPQAAESMGMAAWRPGAPAS